MGRVGYVRDCVRKSWHDFQALDGYKRWQGDEDHDDKGYERVHEVWNDASDMYYDRD